MDAEDLLAAVFPDQVACAENLAGPPVIPDHPLVNQTVRDCLEEAMDIDSLEALLASIEKGEKKLVARDLVEPSPLAQEILNARPYAFLDDAPLEERRTRAVYQRRWLDPETAADLGTLDLAAIERVRSEAWPQVTSADELHDALVELGFLTEGEGLRGAIDGEATSTWRHYLEELSAQTRAAVLREGEGPLLWVAAERLAQLGAVFPSASLEPPITAPERLAQVEWSPQEALVEIVRGRLEGLGPVTATEMAESAGLPVTTVDEALLRLEAEGFVMRGKFVPGRDENQWCSRRLLARIHRYTLNRLRQEIEPVSSADFIRFLAAWQKVAPDYQVEGPESLVVLIDQMEGFEAPAVAWEGEILPSRLTDYDPAWLDSMCLSGQVVWARLTMPKHAPDRSRGPGPVRTTPIALIARRNLGAWSAVSFGPEADVASGLSPSAQLVHEYLMKRGACFFTDLMGDTHLLRTQVDEALGELVAAGLVTADSFSGLRALLTPSSLRTQAAQRRRRRGAIYDMASAGRWSLLIRDSSATDRQTNHDLERLDRIARVLLSRYGVVFNRLLEREGLAAPWRDLLKVYHRLEARGEIRGGRFVAGFSGEQFALPEAVEMLRSIRRAPENGTLVSVSAADPMNLIGIITPGNRLPAAPANRILYRDGVPLATLESGEVRFCVDMDKASQWHAKNTLVRRSFPPELRLYLGRSA
jgi:ATP-dependent Lhr-like helicase